MAQWVKNLTAAAWVAVEVQVRPQAWQSGLKDLALPEALAWVAAVAWMQSLAQELPYAVGVAIK